MHIPHNLQLVKNDSQGVQADFVFDDLQSQESDDEIIETFPTKKVN